MGRRPRSSGPTTNKPLVIFATILVVAGIVGVAYISSLRNTPTVQLAVVTSSHAATGTVMEPQLFLVNNDTVSLMAADGTMERLTFGAFAARMKNHALPINGSNAATGAPVQFRIGASSSTAQQSFISPQGTYVARRLPPSENDNASAIEITRGSEAPQKIILRDNNIPLKDADILGWFSNRDLAVAVTVTSSRAIYAISVAGSPRFVASLPDGLAYLSARDSAVWYTTAVPGPGIESPQRGPSEVHRIDADGTDTRIVRDESHVILSVVPDPTQQNVRIAYVTDNGKAYIAGGGAAILLGRVRPLLFVANGDLIARDGFNLVRIDHHGGTPQKLTAIPEGNVDVFDASVRFVTSSTSSVL